MWGVGCVFSEMFRRHPILQGVSDQDQAHCIFKLLGGPTPESMPGYEKLPGGHVSFPYMRTLEEQFRDLDKASLSLLSDLLKLDPQRRLTAVDALSHPFSESIPALVDQKIYQNTKIHMSWTLAGLVKNFNHQCRQQMTANHLLLLRILHLALGVLVHRLDFWTMRCCRVEFLTVMDTTRRCTNITMETAAAEILIGPITISKHITRTQNTAKTTCIRPIVSVDLETTNRCQHWPTTTI